MLTPDGLPVGTCFQVAPRVLVTAAHVLAGLGADAEGDEVRIEPLGGGRRRIARVEATDHLADLAVLSCSDPLDGSVSGLVATAGVPLGTELVVTGVADVPDRSHTFSHLDATGTWAGSTVRDGEAPLGRIEAKAIMRGMSGAPVRRRSDDRVVAVVSARYNPPDTWGRDTVWVARTEPLEALCAPLARMTVARERPVARSRTGVRWVGGAVAALLLTAMLVALVQSRRGTDSVPCSAHQSVPIPPNPLENPSFERPDVDFWRGVNETHAPVPCAPAVDGGSVGKVTYTPGTTPVERDLRGTYTLGSRDLIQSTAGLCYRGSVYVAAASYKTLKATINVTVRESAPETRTRIGDVMSATVELETGFQQLITAPYTATRTGNIIDIYVTQYSAEEGHAFYVDAFSITDC